MADKYKQISRVLFTILLANIAVAALKVIIGTIIKSSSMTADGFHSVTDASSNIVGLIGIRIASKPVDKNHPYGHKKFETLCGLFISGMLFFIGFKVIADAVKRFINPLNPQITNESLLALLATLIINIIVSTLEYRRGKKLGSDILISDSIHTRSDIFVSLGVLIGLVCINLGVNPIIDPIISLIVAGFIIHAAYGILASSSGVLVDKRVIDPELIEKVAIRFDGVNEVHGIRSRGREDDVYIDMHVLVDFDMSIGQSHKLVHNIEKRLIKELDKDIQLTIHFEPYNNNDDDLS